jgi:hypothetical protein
MRPGPHADQRLSLPGGADQFIENSRKFIENSPFHLANVVRLT